MLQLLPADVYTLSSTGDHHVSLSAARSTNHALYVITLVDVVELEAAVASDRLGVGGLHTLDSALVGTSNDTALTGTAEGILALLDVNSLRSLLRRATPTAIVFIYDDCLDIATQGHAQRVFQVVS